MVWGASSELKQKCWIYLRRPARHKRRRRRPHEKRPRDCMSKAGCMPRRWERCENILADRRRLDEEALQRAAERREQGVRGRVRDVQNCDLNRSAGGAWQAGRH